MRYVQEADGRIFNEQKKGNTTVRCLMTENEVSKLIANGVQIEKNCSVQNTPTNHYSDEHFQEPLAAPDHEFAEKIPVLSANVDGSQSPLPDPPPTFDLIKNSGEEDERFKAPGGVQQPMALPGKTY